ncbi:MAG: hypothetical protein Q7T11_06865 [Deltaproteobacteria bacterium]|nr:hypothetical protein [Deltaproteobacteria bacterium]
MKALLLILLIAGAGCGSIDKISLNPNADITGTESVFLFATDFISSGQLYTAPIDTVDALPNTGVTGLGSSAGIRVFDGLLYVLHDGFSSASSDNVQILDPANGLATVNQWSTGNGTNPQDLIVVGNTAYISLYNPEQDPENVDDEGHPADVIVMDLETGDITNRISFFDSLNDDGARLGHAQAMVLVDDIIYVCLQDLEADFSQNASGLIGIIHMKEDHAGHENHGVIPLQGRNPVGISYDEEGNRLFVALQAPFDSMTFENQFASLPFGGVEVVSLEDESSTLIPDDDLGGYVERLASGEGQVFAVASQMDLATFAFTSTIFKISLDDLASSVFLSGSQDVRDIAVDSQNRLWVSRRSITAGDGSASEPQVEVFDGETGAAVGTPLIPVVPVTSIAIGKI